MIGIRGLTRALSNLNVTKSAQFCRPSGGLLACTSLPVQDRQELHTSGRLLVSGNPKKRQRDMTYKIANPPEPKKWPKYNEIVYPPTPPGEPRRPAEVTHYRANVLYSERKLWYICHMVRGLSIDEAIKQLSFYERKGAKVLKEVLEEAQEMAVKDHNVEYKSNLWVADAHTGFSFKLKYHRRRARKPPGEIERRYVHVFVRLREGRPPKHYFEQSPTGHEYFEDYIQELRDRQIINSL